MAGIWQASRPHLVAVDPVSSDAISRFGFRMGIHMRGVRTVIFFGQAKAPAHFALQHWWDKFCLLLCCAEVTQHQYLHEVANDTAFVLKIVMQPQSLMRQMVADDSHGQIRAILPAIFGRNCKAVMSSFVGDLTHFGKQCPPVCTRVAVIVPIGTRMFAAVVEKADIVIARFNRLDLAFNECVKFGQIVRNVVGNFKQHQ